MSVIYSFIYSSNLTSSAQVSVCYCDTYSLIIYVNDIVLYGEFV